MPTSFCRDPSTEYTRGATDGAPQAVQVADRFHLLTNLRESLERLLDRKRADVRGIVLPATTSESPIPPGVHHNSKPAPVPWPTTEYV